jgi:phenylacetate-CoA ligase
MKRLETLYSKLPEWLQDAAVTVQGAAFRRQRYGLGFDEEYALLKATEQAPALQLELVQAARLKRMIQHAQANVPYYRSLRPGLADKLRAGDLSFLRDIPTTPKNAVRSFPDQFCDGGKVRREWIPWNTSGTTGSPMTLYYSRRAVARQYAFVERYRELAGVSRFHRRAQFTGKMIVPTNTSSRYWRFDWANQALMLSSVHLDQSTIPEYLSALREFRPAYISGYPSAIALLARHAVRFPKESIRLQAVLTSAETLSEEQRDLIESAFQSKVFDQYGQTEMQSFWFECRYRRMHAHPLFGVTEILRPNGDPCRPGEVGSVVLTGFINDAMPLIRYEVGDRAAWADEERCPCGRNMPAIAVIEGRQDDYIFSPERGLVGRLDPALKGVDGILECQFRQEVPTRLRVLFVPLPSFCRDDLRQLERNLKQRLGSSMEVDFCEVPQIPRGANGKFRTVVSGVRQAQVGVLGMEEVA